MQSEITQLSTRINALRAAPVSVSTTEQINSLQASRQGLIAQNATLVSSGLAQGTSASLAAAAVAASDPISPKKSLNLIGGLLLGLIIGVGLAWTRNRLRPAVHSAEDVTSSVDLPLLASVPLKQRFAADDPALQEAYGVLHTNLMFAMRGDVRVVTIVGYNPGVGKTSTVQGLAAAATRGDREVLMIDGDMRAASLSERLGQSNRPGLVDVLQGAIPLDDALVSVDDGVWLLPTRRSRVNPASVLSGPATTDLIAEVRSRFDLVLIDSPPLSGLADGLILASQSDVVLLVARTGITKPADLLTAKTSVGNSMTPIAGTVVFEERATDTYYGAAPTGRAARSARIGR